MADINEVISSPAFKAAKPEVQRALLLKHFPDRYGTEDTNDTGEDFSSVTGGSSTTPIKAIRLKVSGQQGNSWLKVQDIIIH